MSEVPNSIMQENKRGLLIVVSGPSGVGKGTICKSLLVRNPRVHFSVSATTRKPRPGEVDGVDYFFKSVEEFERMIAQDEFLEHMRVFGTSYYGTPRDAVEEDLAVGHDVLLEIDVNGALNVKKAAPDAVSIFIGPPSMSELKSRLIGRGTESPEALEKRFNQAFSEMQTIADYDYLVINDVLDAAVAAVEDIISAERMRVSRRTDIIKKLQGGAESL